MERNALRSLTLTLLLLIPGLVFSQSDSQPLVLMKASAPKPEVLESYNRGHCVASNHQVRVCKQSSDERDVFVVEKNGKQTGVWPAASYMGETSDFEVLRADFNHDGRGELIIANHDGSSQGLGVNYWTIMIFPDADTAAEPLMFSVEEYGSFGTFVPDNHGVRILTTRWVWTKDPKGKRDVGLYMVGHWWRYESGALVPQSNRQPIARRYLFSFANERGDTWESDQIPYRWFRNAKAEALKPDQITGPSSKSQAGTIDDVSVSIAKDLRRTAKITFRPNGESPVIYNYPRPDDEKVTDANFDFIGDAATGRIYPIRYLPAQIVSWLKGKRATLRVYGRSEWPEKILWLER